MIIMIDPHFHSFSPLNIIEIQHQLVSKPVGGLVNLRNPGSNRRPELGPHGIRLQLVVKASRQGRPHDFLAPQAVLVGAARCFLFMAIFWMSNIYIYSNI